MYELLRVCGYGALVEYGGAWGADVEQGITSGRALELDFMDSDWPDTSHAAALVKSLAADACRVTKVNAASVTGEARMGVVEACFGAPTVTSVKSVLYIYIYFFF